jgi:hypothetical protein
MCLDNKKLLILDTDMATNPCMYSGTQKKQHKNKKNFGQKMGKFVKKKAFFGNFLTNPRDFHKSFDPP